MDNHSKEIWCTLCAFAQLQFKVTIHTTLYPLAASLYPHHLCQCGNVRGPWFKQWKSSQGCLSHLIPTPWCHDTCIYNSLKQIVCGLKWRGPSTVISNLPTRSLLLSCCLWWQSPKSSSTILSEETVQKDGQSFWRTYAYNLCKEKPVKPSPSDPKLPVLFWVYVPFCALVLQWGFILMKLCMYGEFS